MGKTLYLMSSGTLKRKDNTLFIDKGESEKPRYLPVERTDEIMVFGEVDINKSLLEFLTQNQIILHFFNHYGYYAGTYYPREHMNSGAVILAQAANYMDSEKRHKLASILIIGAIQNMRKVVGYYQRRGSLDVMDILKDLECFEELVPETKDIPSLMGMEGNARNCYYKFFDRLIQDEVFKMVDRTRRPPTNRMNALISFLNTMCYILALSQIYRTHLDPRIGFLHETNFRRFSLNLDLAEIFKPVLVDRLIFTLVNKRMIQEKHFEKKTGGGIYLNDKGRDIVVRSWEERISETIEHPKLKRNVSYRGLVRMEAYKIEKHILGDGDYEPFVSRW